MPGLPAAATMLPGKSIFSTWPFDMNTASLPIANEHGNPAYFISRTAVLIEHLNALVLTVGDPDQSADVDAHPVRDLELPWLIPLAAP